MTFTNAVVIDVDRTKGLQRTDTDDRRVMSPKHHILTNSSLPVSFPRSPLAF